jgi:tetratricopeptide (TPR) repeat protein
LLFAAFLLLAAISVLWGSPAHAEKRVALVIGNSAYQHAVQLANPVNDAKLMADTLRGLGFFVVGGGAKLDLDKAGFDAALTEFGKELNGADVALFYYAGHGIETHGLNYLAPIDTNPVDEGDVLAQGEGLAGILDEIEKGDAKINILLLDACRDNPFRNSGARSATGGLAQMEAPPGTLISFATQPRSVALDGDNGDSPYTRALAETIQHPGYGLFKTFNEVGLKVEKATHGAQLPWVSLSPISGNFYFAGRAEPATTQAPAAAIPPLASAPTEVARLTPDEHQRRDLVTDCDRLAGMPSDTGIPTSLHGVDLDKIDIPAATTACNDAMLTYPDVPRFAFEAGRVAQVRKDFVQARNLYEKAFAGGYGIAANGIANLYSDGEGMHKDMSQAAQWYKKSADAGEPAAMLALAWLYQTGNGVAKDCPEAIRLYDTAGKLGLASAVNSMGLLYDSGTCVQRDFAVARRWFEQASALGDGDAMNNMGTLYKGGHGVPHDTKTARQWFEKAAALGVSEAKQNLREMGR